MAGLVLADPESVCNAALVEIGSRRRIGSLFDGSPESVRCLDVYGQTRDAKLRAFDWGFAEREVVLNVLKLAPAGGYNTATPWTSAYPAQPWIFEYAYPADCLKLRSLRDSLAPIPNFDPRPSLFRIANDTIAAVQQKVILSNLAAAVLVYTAQVTDPTLWEPAFTDALIADLGERLSAALATLDNTKVEAEEDAARSQRGQMELG